MNYFIFHEILTFISKDTPYSILDPNLCIYMYNLEKIKKQQEQQQERGENTKKKENIKKILNLSNKITKITEKININEEKFLVVPITTHLDTERVIQFEASYDIETQDEMKHYILLIVNMEKAEIEIFDSFKSKSRCKFWVELLFILFHSIHRRTYTVKRFKEPNFVHQNGSLNCAYFCIFYLHLKMEENLTIGQMERDSRCCEKFIEIYKKKLKEMNVI